MRGETAERAGDIIRQVGASREITILKGHISSDPGQLMVSAPPNLSPAPIAQFIKGVASRTRQDAFPLLKTRDWGQPWWARGYFGGPVGAVTEEQIKLYIDHQLADSSAQNFRIEP